MQGASSLSMHRSSNLSRVKAIALANRAFLGVLAVLGLTIAIVVGSKQTASYVSTSTLQLQNLNLASSASDFSMDFSVENDMRLKLENSSELFHKEILLKRVAEIILQPKNSDRILLPNPKKKNLLGVSGLVPAKNISREDLMSILSDMVKVNIDKDRNSLEIVIRAQTAISAETASNAFTEMFLEVTQLKTLERIQVTTKFFQEQLNESRKSLIIADEKLSEYSQNNSYLQNNISRNEFIRLRERKQEIIDEIASQNKLIVYYQERIREVKSIVSPPLNAVRVQLQNEIQQLEYDRMKYISEGYSQDNPGIVKLDEKISRLKKVIETQLDRSPASNPAMEADSAARIKEMSQKILSIQDEVEGKGIALRNIEARVRELGPSFDVLPEREAVLNRLRRDAEVASQLYLQLSSHVNIMNVRTASENGNWTITSEPSPATGPVGVIPIYSLLLFGVTIGLALGLSILLIREIIDPRLVNRDDSESMGFIYSGRISDNLSEQAEVLATLGLIGSFDANEEKQGIITCASPDKSISIEPTQALTSYLSSQGYPTLTIVLGDVEILAEYGLPVSIEFANIYRHADGKRDIVQVADKDTFVSLQNLITTSSNRYHAIFLVFKDPLNNPSYPLGLKMANKLLICGTAHEHTMETYHFLTKGFRFRKSIYFAFLPSLKDSLRQKIRSNLDSNYKGRVLAGPGKIQAEEPEESLNKSA